MTALIIGGLITWLLTTIMVESEIARPIRDWVERRTLFEFGGNVMKAIIRQINAGVDQDAVVIPKMRWYHKHGISDKVFYLITCHLCTGVWIGWLVALVVPGPLSIWVLNGLAYKGVAHLVLAVVNWLDGWEAVHVHVDRQQHQHGDLHHTFDLVDPRHPSVWPDLDDDEWIWPAAPVASAFPEGFLPSATVIDEPTDPSSHN